MVKLSDSVNNPLEVAKSLSAEGLQVFPARYKDKIPLVKWREYQNQDASPMLSKWFKGRGNINYWILTGTQSGYVVVDADSEDGDAWWRSQLGDELLDSTAQVKTAKGTHYWFKIPDGWDKPIQSWPCHPGKDDDHDISFDFRADEMGVIAPPSVHESGHVYQWARPLSEAQEAPLPMLDGSIRANKPVTTGDAQETTVGTGGQTRSMLSRLLEQPPGGDGSGRNDWLARVAGHYAKVHHNERDLFETQVKIANGMMGQPLDDAEFRKTVDSIWKGEHERNQHRSIDASVGYLASGETTLQCQVVIKQGEDKTYQFVEYADFDLRAKGVMTDEAGRRTYWAEIVRRRRGGSRDIERIDIVLRAEVLGDERAFRKFLAGYACTVLPPDNMWPKAGSPALRIQRYLEAQQPPVVEITPALGFHPTAISADPAVGGFVTHDGVITGSGLRDLAESAVRADPRLKAGGTAPHHYGFVDNPVIARDVLTEVLTFHDETVCSVFGSWWAAALLKPQIEQATSLFPFVAIEAPSESGKTNGFFQMMTQMNGNTRGETQPTKAALRDMAAAHRNGIVWVDDLDDPAYLMELLRAATSGGSLTKMGEDRESVKNTPIVAPIVISGEALGLGTQKALLDRSIILKAPSPTARRSMRDPSKPQWDDILDLRDRYPDGLHELAGWYVQEALNRVPETLAALKAGRTGGSGRSADKVAVLRAGSRLLDSLVGHDDAWEGTGPHATRVEQWLRGTLTDDDGVAISTQENALTLEVLPWALRKWKFPDKAYAGEGQDPDGPVFVRKMTEHNGEQLFGEDIEIWFHPALLSEAWFAEHRGQAEKRTTTEAAFKDQAQALGSKSKRVKIANGGGRLAYYYKLDGSVALSVVDRALGR
jgi:hypothetical protein